MYQVAAAVSIIESMQASIVGSATTLKNLYFTGTFFNETYDDYEGYYYLQAFDIYYQGPAPKVIGKIESTGNDMFQYYLSGFGDYSGLLVDAQELSWNDDVQENLAYTVDYQYQPMLPSLVEIDQVFSYVAEKQIDATGKYGFVTIRNCEIEDAYVYGTDHYAEDSAIVHIDLNNGGYVSIDRTTFTKCKTSSSIVEVINTKGISVTDCTFTRNIGRLSSAILLADVPMVRICHTSFEKNYAYVAGALTLLRVEDALVINSKFRKNSGMCGASAIVAEDSKLSINGTQFLRNNNDVMHWIVPKDYQGYEEEELISQGPSSHGIKTHENFSATISVYGNKSVLILGNVAFNDNEEETGIGPQFSSLISYDGYAEESVKIIVEDSCTDNKRYNFNYNWSDNLKYSARKCELNRTYDYREKFVPVPERVEVYDFVKNNADYILTKVTKSAILYDLDERVDVISNLTFTKPPPRPTPYPIPPPIKEGLAPYKTVLISVGSICFVVLVVGVALIYKYRKKPENRLKKKTPEQKAVMDGLMEKKNDGEDAGDYMPQVDEPPAIETQEV
jgi:hypothetical protein